MIKIQIDSKELTDTLAAVVKNLPRELSFVSKQTAKHGVSFIAKQVGAEIAVAQKEIKKLIKVKKLGDTDYMIDFQKTKRLPIRVFKAKQTKKGVTYKIDKNAKPKLIKKAFMGPRPGVLAPRLHGKVWIRELHGGSKSRSIHPVGRGPSPWGVFVKNDMMPALLVEINQRLTANLRERIRVKKLKLKGK